MISDKVNKRCLYRKYGLTKSRSKEIKMTRKICLRLTGDTGMADIVGRQQTVVVDSLKILYVQDKAC